MKNNFLSAAFSGTGLSLAVIAITHTDASLFKSSIVTEDIAFSVLDT